MTEEGKAAEKKVTETTVGRLGEVDLSVARLQQKTATEYRENILENISDGFWVLDRQWRYTYINNRQAELIGMQKDDVLGKNIWELFPDTTGSEIYIQLHRAVNEQTPLKFEHFHPTCQCWFENRVYPSANGVSILTLDISDRKQAEQASQDRQRLIQQLAEMSPGLLYLYDVVEQRNIYINARSLELLGYSPETVVTMGANFMAQVMHPDDLAKIPAYYQQLNTLVEGSFLELEYRMQHVNGEWRWFSSRDTVFSRTPAGQIHQILGTAQDITERKRTEQALQQSQELFQSFMNNSPVRAYIKDEAGHYIYINRCIEQLSHRSLADWFGKTDFDLFPAAIATEWRENDLTVLSTNQPLQKLEREPGGDNEGYVMSFKFPFQDASRRRLVAGMSIDVSDRVRAETALRQSEERLKLANERFQLAATAVNCLIYDWNLEHDIVERTEGLTRILGYSLAEAEPTSRWWCELIHPEDFPRVWNEAVTVLANKDYYTGEYRILNKHKQYIYVSDACIVVARNAEGQPTRIVGSTIDISDRKRVEEELRKREQRFSRLFNGMKDWVLVYHLNADHQPGQLIEVNEQACKCLGYTRQELLHMSVADIIASPASNTKANIEKLLTDKHIIVESVHKTKDGQLIPVEVSATLFTLNGLPTVQSICRDITERKQTEEALRKSERLYRAIGETLNYGIWVCDAEGRNIYASDSLLQLVGLTQQQCSEFGWGNVLHPDDAENTIAAWKECVRTGGTWDIEHRYRGVDGNWHPILARGIPVKDENGTVLCWAGINLDISKLKQTEAALRQSEEQFRQLADVMPQIVWTTDANGKLEYVNQKWCDYAGVTFAQGRRREYSSQVIHPDDVESVHQEWQVSLETGTPYQKECRLQRAADKVYRWFLVRAVPIRNEQGQIIQWYGTSTDIDDRKRAEQEREQLLERERTAREQAEAANRIKDEFLAVLSHELRSPLNPILGWTTLLRTRKFDQQATERALETIERNAKLQTQLIEDLLDISRILQGKIVLNVGAVNLLTVIEAALETVQLAAEAKNIEIQKDFATDIGQVSGDAGRLQQIVWNLLSNAIKFTSSGGLVQIRLQRVGNYAQIQVQDSGKGITPEFLPHVFEYFRQEDSTTTRLFGGLGLGLAIVRHLSELHGGTVGVESPGEDLGATFTVRLPLLATLPQINQVHEQTVTNSDLSRVRILIVDDEADMRNLLAMILEMHGAQIQVAASATEALLILEQYQPDVLISDIGMPEIDGYMLMRQIRSRSPQQGGQIPAIALTAYAGEYNQRQALAAGFQLHVSKPVEVEQLVEAIAQIISETQFRPRCTEDNK